MHFINTASMIGPPKKSKKKKKKHQKTNKQKNHKAKVIEQIY